MDNLGFVVAAYAVAFTLVAGYAWWLRGRLRQAREGSATMQKLQES